MSKDEANYKKHHWHHYSIALSKLFEKSLNYFKTNEEFTTFSAAVSEEIKRVSVYEDVLSRADKIFPDIFKKSTNIE